MSRGPFRKDALKYMQFVSHEVYELWRFPKIDKFLPLLHCHSASKCLESTTKLWEGQVKSHLNTFSRTIECLFLRKWFHYYSYYQSNYTFLRVFWSKESKFCLCFICNIFQLMRSCFSWCISLVLLHVSFLENIRRFNLP